VRRARIAIEFGTDLGAPENVTAGAGVPVAGRRDRAVERGRANRTISFVVQVMAGRPGCSRLRTRRAALLAESERVLNTVAVDPGDGVGAVPTVFEVVPRPGGAAAGTTTSGDRLGCGAITVTVSALPFGKSAAEVVTPAVVASGGDTTLDACSTNTGWTGNVDASSATVVNAAGANTVSTGSAGSHLLAMTKTFGSTSTTAKKYVVVDYQTSEMAYGLPDAYADGVRLTRFGSMPSPVTSGFVRFYFVVSSLTASISTLRVEWQSSAAATASSFTITNVLLTGTRPTSGSTGRQQSLSVEVAGSARTPGQLQVSSPSAALGETVIYTFRETGDAGSYQPPMRRWIASSAASSVTDTATISGAYNVLDASTPLRFSAPRVYLPKGTYLAMARMRSSSGTTVGEVRVEAATSVSSIIGSGFTIQAQSPVTATTAWRNVALGRLTLPTVELVQNTIGAIAVDLYQDITSGANFHVDEFWLFNMEIGTLVWVDCGSGTPGAGVDSDRLWVEPTSPLRPRPQLWVGPDRPLRRMGRPRLHDFRYGEGACGMFEASWSMPLPPDFSHPLLRRGTLVELMDGPWRSAPRWSSPSLRSRRARHRGRSPRPASAARWRARTRSTRSTAPAT
jgi:hypothetical protein